MGENKISSAIWGRWGWRSRVVLRRTRRGQRYLAADDAALERDRRRQRRYASDGVRDHPGMPFGIIPDSAFGFAGIPTDRRRFPDSNQGFFNAFSRLIKPSVGGFTA